ncbi:unnamed protein product [Heligmosomoides polygyrus]|uniref:2-C-methyl-D-erythritol 2,4-cyclodiphosphate synthase n=1 Tax=Heligmosomoides polygyrus TaxID=6339 RepID=A0A183G4D4_HELPZ|nr:unnamed protein product [Heligmosomoides polygyrus]
MCRLHLLCEGITRHAPIDTYAVHRPYEEALRKVKEAVADLTGHNRLTEEESVDFAAPESARMLEKDGERIGVRARVIVTFV